VVKGRLTINSSAVPVISQSPRTRHLLKAVGSGGSVQIVSALPATGSRVRVSPVLSRKAKTRLKWSDYAKSRRVGATCQHFGIARSPYYECKKRYNPTDLTTHETRSSRPRRCRGRQWTVTPVEAVRAAREAHPGGARPSSPWCWPARGLGASARAIGRRSEAMKGGGQPPPLSRSLSLSTLPGLLYGENVAYRMPVVE